VSFNESLETFGTYLYIFPVFFLLYTYIIIREP